MVGSKRRAARQAKSEAKIVPLADLVELVAFLTKAGLRDELVNEFRRQRATVSIAVPTLRAIQDFVGTIDSNVMALLLERDDGWLLSFDLTGDPAVDPPAPKPPPRRKKNALR